MTTDAFFTNVFGQEPYHFARGDSGYFADTWRESDFEVLFGGILVSRRLTEDNPRSYIYMESYYESYRRSELVRVHMNHC